jgi:hypothetical protein
MGEIIVMNIPGSYYCWIAFGIGIASLLALLLSEVSNETGKSKKVILIWLIVSSMIFGVGVSIHRDYDIPTSKANYEATMNRLQTIQAAYQEKPFFLKEEACEPGIWGEVEGYVGGLIFFGGNIYGRIDSGRVVTVVYEDNDPIIDSYIGVHRSISFHLDQAVIETILTGEHPYVMYPEARIDVCPCGDQLTLVPRNPHLYLPEGWKIL